MNAHPHPDLFTAAPPDGVPKDIVELFETYALQIIAAGFDRSSARFIFHRMRWHHHIERGDRDFAVNNNWSAPLARWFMAKHPQYGKFFETREKRSQ